MKNHLILGPLRSKHHILFLILLMATILGAYPLSAQVKVACVGNSITYGSGIENREKYSYPAQLQIMLGEAWEVKNFGVSGRTILKKGDHPLWEEEAFAEALAYQPDVVIIKLGTNDSKDFNWKHRDEFMADYQAMIDTFRQVSGPVIFACLPVPAFESRWSIDGSVILNEVIPMIREVAHKNQLPVIDLYRPFTDMEERFPDKIHPDGHGAALMAGVATRYLLAYDYLILETKMRP